MNPYKSNLIPRTVLEWLMTCLLIMLSVAILAADARAETHYLSTGKITAITGGTGATYWLGQRATHRDTTRTPLLKGPLPFEKSVQHFFGGQYKPGKRNFLDNDKGGLYTPIAAAAILMTADQAWPQDDRSKESLQDFLLFTSGLIATKGVTDIAKGLVSRPRPYMTLVPAEQGERNGFRSDRASMFSGHTSAAFFSAAYLNLRLRSIMRAEQSPDEYRNWRWAPPTVLFGWASFVGLSRVHAYKHYMSDVIIGAVAGYLMAELFYSLGENGGAIGSSSESHDVMLRLSFPL